MSPTFAKLAKQLDTCDTDRVLELVTKALDLLYSEESTEVFDNRKDESCVTTLGVNEVACMLVVLIAQWLVRFTCKKLMQLMTPEDLILTQKYVYV